jgi:cytochrome c-type biogenesis protein CcmH
MTKFLRSFWLWLAAAIVVIVVAFLAAPSASSTQQRINHLESLVKCPACEDLSVAESNATSAIAVRHEIVLKVQQGESDTAILTSLEDSYGTSILLSPSTSGIGSLLWVLPVIIVIVGVGAYLRLVRRK